MELVTILYENAIDAVQSARGHLAAGRIMDRGRAVSRAVVILVELSNSLDHQKGGALSQRLSALYDYMRRTLLEANRTQTDAGLAETEKLLKTLQEAWTQIAPASAGERQVLGLGLTA